MAKYNKLAGKHIVVIGGTKGIGHGVAEACIEASAGAVTIAGSSQASADAAVASLRAAYPSTKIVGIGCDLSGKQQQDNLESSLDTLLATAAAGAGVEIDHIVFTAADALTLGSLDQLTVEGAQKAAHMRMIVPLMLGKVARRHLAGAGRGPGARDKSLILTTGSIADKPAPGWSLIAYFAAGLVGLTRNLALDLSPIRVNVVEPGMVNTALWDAGGTFKSVAEREASLNEQCKHLPVGKPAAVEEVAEAYMYLLRDSNATGECVATRGGQHLI
ncbi:short-chain dehydrogenase [Xylariaceae sp. FL0594]|nr:short-chain dehydrogenase [Xylariaceae sp. FL0594]